MKAEQIYQLLDGVVGQMYMVGGSENHGENYE